MAPAKPHSSSTELTPLLQGQIGAVLLTSGCSEDGACQCGTKLRGSMAVERGEKGDSSAGGDSGQ